MSGSSIWSISTECYGRIDNYIRNSPRSLSTSSSIQGTNTSFSLQYHLFKSNESIHSSDSHHSSSVYSISSSQKTKRVLSSEFAEAKIARQNLQIELQRLKSSIAQIDQQYANEVAIRTQTINEIAEDKRKLAAWLKERNEAIAKK
jgi:hypothetical protein